MSLSALPGDPDVVNTEAVRMQQAAERMSQAAKRLRHLAAGSEVKSEAVDAMRKNADDLAEVMTHSSVRYRGAGNALVTYASELSAAQDEADEAIRTMNGTDVAGARHAADHAQTQSFLAHANPTTDEAERYQRQQEALHTQQHLHDQQAVALHAQQKYDEAVRRVEQAAKTAASKIQDAEEASALNDAHWYGSKRFWTGLLEHASAYLEIVSVALLAVSFLLACTGIGLGLAALLLTLSSVTAVMAVAAKVALFFMGEKSLGSLLLDLALSVGAASKVLKFGKNSKYVAKSRLGVKLGRTASQAGHQVVHAAGPLGRKFEKAIPRVVEVLRRDVPLPPAIRRFSRAQNELTLEEIERVSRVKETLKDHLIDDPVGLWFNTHDVQLGGPKFVWKSSRVTQPVLCSIKVPVVP